MLRLEHNHDTALNTLANRLATEFKAMDSYRDITGMSAVNEDGFISIAGLSLKNDIEALISALIAKGSSDGFLPRIVLCPSIDIDHTKFLAQGNFRNQSEIKVVNKVDSSDFHILRGAWFEYTSKLQILIFSKTRYVSKEISLELLAILARIKRTQYRLRLYSAASPSDYYELENYGTIDLMGFETTPFQSEVVADGTMLITGIEIDVREAYFRLKSTDLYRKYEINPTVKSL